jgi:protein-disulfide isomerase
MHMGTKPLFIHLLVIGTAIAAAALIAAGAVYEVSTPPAMTRAEISDARPRIGRLEAKTEIILIEDFLCGPCQYFTQKIFPEIYEKFIETGHAYCIIVPVSFIEGSEPLANAALSVNRLAPDRFLPFLHALIDHISKRDDRKIEPALLLEVAQNVGGIDIDRLRKCIETDCFSLQLEQNLEWEKKMMGRSFGTPSLFVDGIRTSTSSIETIEAEIEKVNGQ